MSTSILSGCDFLIKVLKQVDLNKGITLKYSVKTPPLRENYLRYTKCKRDPESTESVDVGGHH